MNFKSIIFFLVSTYLSLASAGGVLDNKILSFSGTNSIHGSYTGKLEIRNDGGNLSATRITTYDSFKFENLTVQEVWTGQVTFDSKRNVYLIRYQLRQADFLNSVDNLSRTAENFKNKTYVYQNIVVYGDSLTTGTISRDKEAFQETFTQQSPIGPQPLWKNERYRIESVDHESSTIFKIAGKLLDMRVFDWFHDQPVPRSYANRKEYRSKQQFMVYDPTDFKFYRANRDVLRVVNKTPDTISLVEDIQRRNAYAPTLAEKMNHFENDMKAYHLNEYGMYSGALFSADGQFQKFIMDGDSALGQECIWQHRP